MLPNASVQPSVCTRCGVIAPVRGTRCSICQQSLEETRRMVPNAGDIYWIAVRCTFQCRSCAFPSPLEGIELDSAVNCAQCGAFQHFDASSWPEALRFAHEVGDLSGPSPEGRFAKPYLWIGDDNPFREVGVTKTFESQDAGAMKAQAAPGYPTCAACCSLLEFRLEGNVASTRCPRCADAARYELPTEALGFLPELRAVIAPRQRVDRQSVRVEQTPAGLSALLCPRCGASVRPSGSEMVVCEYCQTASVLPTRLRTRRSGELIQPRIWWIAVQGPSERRSELERFDAASDRKSSSKAKGVVGLLKRGLTPLPGIELAPVRPGFDLRQFALTLSLSALALGLGAAALTAIRVLK